MKKFFTITKFLWIGAIMGVIQQLFGELDYLLYQGHGGVFEFSQIMDSLALYAAIILLVILRDVPPKHQLMDLFLFFVGLDLFYYVYIFIIELIAFISDKLNPPEVMFDDVMYFSQSIHEIGDFIKWTTIGLAATVWALVATKLRNRGKKKLYIIMLLPLFAVMVIQLISAIISTTMFFVTGGDNIPVPGEPGAFVSYPCEIISGLTALVSLIVCLYKSLKKPAVNKNHIQEA